MHLPDVNFWLALVFESHAHHLAAKTWMLTAPIQSCCFCRLTQMGFLRLTTNRKIFPSDALTMRDAWQVYDTLLSDHRIIFADEPNGLETQWRSMTQSRLFSPKVWNDAYLAAFAVTADFEMVTFDNGFSQYKNLRQTILS